MAGFAGPKGTGTFVHDRKGYAIGAARVMGKDREAGSVQESPTTQPVLVAS